MNVITASIVGAGASCTSVVCVEGVVKLRIFVPIFKPASLRKTTAAKQTNENVAKTMKIP